LATAHPCRTLPDGQIDPARRVGPPSTWVLTNIVRILMISILI
jgi:hypothetical protein